MYGVVLTESSNVLKLFQLSQLKELLCISYEHYTAQTRFKEDLLQYFPALEAHKNGKQVILTPDSVASDADIDAITRSRQDDGMCLVQAAKVIRQDMFDKARTFHVNFDKKSQ